MNELMRNPVSDPVLAYQEAISRRAYELAETMTRNNFFMVFQGVVVAGALNLSNATKTGQWLWVVVALLGIVLSVLQFQMAASGRYQILEANRIAKARELDLLNAIPKGQPVYHFMTETYKGGSHSSSYTSTCYRDVMPVWRSLGYTADPKKDKQVYERECKLVAREIMRRRSPSVIPIYVALGFVVFWMVALALQFFDLGPVPKLALRDLLVLAGLR